MRLLFWPFHTEHFVQDFVNQLFLGLVKKLAVNDLHSCKYHESEATKILSVIVIFYGSREGKQWIIPQDMLCFLLKFNKLLSFLNSAIAVFCVRDTETSTDL